MKFIKQGKRIISTQHSAKISRMSISLKLVGLVCCIHSSASAFSVPICICIIGHTCFRMVVEQESRQMDQVDCSDLSFDMIRMSCKPRLDSSAILDNEGSSPAFEPSSHQAIEENRHMKRSLYLSSSASDEGQLFSSRNVRPSHYGAAFFFGLSSMQSILSSGTTSP